MTANTHTFAIGDRVVRVSVEGGAPEMLVVDFEDQYLRCSWPSLIAGVMPYEELFHPVTLKLIKKAVR
ncbi:hypothetical protein [Pseudohoeflea coraliihabitans]|uniref:DUF2442 domain-containing protein n=1 Tax=Pseudohoeflea coraliihabitans TaxID=2860393 RepID=A0ABS6WTH4_9HYPH|nr:hypothetical protein [Pseudohoeflea sp. DP4N28-3]MBW3099241.1 hypothetical protein [Pseudohoeflea sp. DP4N28-3]